MLADTAIPASTRIFPAHKQPLTPDSRNNERKLLEQCESVMEGRKRKLLIEDQDALRQNMALVFRFLGDIVNESTYNMWQPQFRALDVNDETLNHASRTMARYLIGNRVSKGQVAKLADFPQLRNGQLEEELK